MGELLQAYNHGKRNYVRVEGTVEFPGTQLIEINELLKQRTDVVCNCFM